MIEWDDGLHAKLTAEATAAKLEQATSKAGGFAQNVGNVDQGMANAVTTPKATYHWRMQTPERLFMGPHGSQAEVRLYGEHRTLPKDSEFPALTQIRLYRANPT